MYAGRVESGFGWAETEDPPAHCARRRAWLDEYPINVSADGISAETVHVRISMPWHTVRLVRQCQRSLLVVGAAGEFPIVPPPV